MPEFQMNDGDRPDFLALPAFTRGYLEAAFFTLPGSDPDLSHLGYSDIMEDGLAEIRKDCDTFLKTHAADIAILVADEKVGAYDEQSAGRDFWYDRNGHGVGFWDRGFEGEAELAADRLSEAARDLGYYDLESVLQVRDPGCPSP